MNLKQALVENDSIRLGLEAKDWKEAVKVAVAPLIESGAILPEYYDAIIESTEEYGPYYKNLLCSQMGKRFLFC